MIRRGDGEGSSLRVYVWISNRGAFWGEIDTVARTGLGRRACRL